MKYPIFDYDNEQAGETEIHPVVAALAHKFNVACVLNTVATEWRWDATGRNKDNELCLACDADPNVAILDCVSQIRGRAQYLGH